MADNIYIYINIGAPEGYVCGLQKPMNNGVTIFVVVSFRSQCRCCAAQSSWHFKIIQYNTYPLVI